MLRSISNSNRVLYLVTDFVPIRLEAVVEHDANYSSAHMLRLSRQIFEAVAFMHSKNVAHRDIKPDV
jgi:serine/threonine protein kinase